MKEKTFDASYVSAFCMEMYLIIRAGVPFSEGVALLREDERNSYRRTVLDHLYEQLELGEPLAAAMRAAGGFPVYVVEMVDIGQRTGHLENVFRSLAGYYERISREASISIPLDKVMTKASANREEAIILLMVQFSLLFCSLLIKVLPIFREVFQQLGAELSPVAQMLMQFGQFLGRYGLRNFFHDRVNTASAETHGNHTAVQRRK